MYLTIVLEGRQEKKVIANADPNKEVWDICGEALGWSECIPREMLFYELCGPDIVYTLSIAQQTRMREGQKVTWKFRVIPGIVDFSAVSIVDLMIRDRRFLCMACGKIRHRPHMARDEPWCNILTHFELFPGDNTLADTKVREEYFHGMLCSRCECEVCEDYYRKNPHRFSECTCCGHKKCRFCPYKHWIMLYFQRCFLKNLFIQST